jgi:Uma2 family endonuclease
MPIVDSTYELTEYELERNKPMPSFNHAYVQTKLLIALGNHFPDRFTLLSEVNLAMDDNQIAVPDISIYPKMPVDFLHDKTAMSQMPLTVLEIMSPSQSNDDMLKRFERYFNAGIKSCWLVMPSLKAIAVYSKLESYEFYSAEMILKDDILGIELPLIEIFK